MKRKVAALILCLLSFASSAFAAPVTLREAVTKQRKVIEMKDEKIRRLEKQLSESSLTSSPRWKKTNGGEDCPFLGLTSAIVGGGAAGWGFGADNKGAKIAGTTVLAASLVFAATTSVKCVGEAIVLGIGTYGPGYWLGQKYMEDQAEKEVGNNALPPPPPPAPHFAGRMNVAVIPVMPAAATSYSGFSPQREKPNWAIILNFKF